MQLNLDANMLHVRGIAGSLEEESALSTLFGQFGACLQVAVRHRIDETGPACTRP